jgi:hypothetical protein
LSLQAASPETFGYTLVILTVNIFQGFGVAESVYGLGYRLDDRGSIPGRQELLLSTTASTPALASIQSPTQCIPRPLSPMVKWTGPGTDHSSPSSAAVKNAWSYASIPQYVFMAWYLVKQRNNFTFIFSKHLLHLLTSTIIFIILQY